MKTFLEILLIEDNEGDIFLTQQAFLDGKFPGKIHVANDGVEGLDFLYKRDKFSHAPTPHLILLDLNMPRMNGKEFLAQMKSDPKLRIIPVIMLTSSLSPKDITDCYELFVNSYVVKPFELKKYGQILGQMVDYWGDLVQLP